VPSIKVSEGCKINYIDWGTGKPIVFLHGRGGSLEFYNYQTEDLSHDFRVIAYDARGHGNSDKPNSEYSHEEYAKDLRNVISALGLDSVNLVGASTGSFVIQKYSQLFGLDSIASITLISSTPVFAAKPDFPLAFPISGFDEIKRKLRSDYPKAVMDFNRFLFNNQPSAETFEWMFNLSILTPLHVLLKTLEANIAMDYRKVLSGIDKPVLIIHGRKDKLCPFEAATFMSQKIPSNRLEPFENSGHCPYLEETPKLNSVLRNFILESA
jgi:non-heme chloroperoxidase